MRDAPSTTAEAVCLMRASDQRRPAGERILDDPYAELFLGPLSKGALMTAKATGKLGELAEEQLLPGITTFILTRHRFIDDCLQAALSKSEIEQLVLLGAGYDTRAYRFHEALKDRSVFEVDHPMTSRRKASIVDSHSDRLPAREVRRVEIDFQTQRLDERLLECGFEQGRRSFFVWEGVSMYLTRAAIKDTLATIRQLGGPGSLVAMDFWYLIDTPDLLSTAHRAAANLLHFLGEPITFAIHPEDVGGFFEREGFQLLEQALAADLESRYVRDARRVYPATYVTLAEST